MKKLLLLSLTLLSVLVIGACNNAPDTTLEDRLAQNEQDIQDLYAILEDIGVIEGLNGQKEYYIEDNKSPLGILFTPVSAYEIDTLGTELDKTKAPSYVLDANEEYVDFETLVNLLFEKYYDTQLSYDGFTVIGFQARIQSSITTEYDTSEFMARTIFLIEELRNYDWYIIGSCELYMYINVNGIQAEIKIPVQTMRSDWVTLTPQVIYDSLYEVKVSGISYNQSTINTLYAEWTFDNIFAGYVLNY